MSDNMFFYPQYPYEDEWDEENYRNHKMKESTNLFTPQETMEYGNLFRDEYVPYLNYQPRKLIAKNDKESRMYELMAMRDYCHDLKLYLDIFPQDQEKKTLYNNAKKKYEELENKNDEQNVSCPGYGPGNGRSYNHFLIPDWIL